MAYHPPSPGVARIPSGVCHALFSTSLGFTLILASCLACARQPAKTIAPAVRIIRAGTTTAPRFEVLGLPTRHLKSLRTRDWNREDWAGD